MDPDFLFEQSTTADLLAVLPAIEHDAKWGLSWLHYFSSSCQSNEEKLAEAQFQYKQMKFLDDAVKAHDWGYVQQARQAFVQPWENQDEARRLFEYLLMASLMRNDTAAEHYDPALDVPSLPADLLLPYREIPKNRGYVQWAQHYFQDFWASHLSLGGGQSSDIWKVREALVNVALMGIDVVQQAWERFPGPHESRKTFFGMALRNLLAQSHDPNRPGKPLEQKWPGIVALAQADIEMDLEDMDYPALITLAQGLSRFGPNATIKRFLETTPLSQSVAQSAACWANLGVENLTQLHQGGIDLAALKLDNGNTFLHGMAQHVALHNRKPLLSWVVFTQPQWLDVPNKDGQTLAQVFAGRANEMDEGVSRLLSQAQAMRLQTTPEAIASRPRMRM